MSQNLSIEEAQKLKTKTEGEICGLLNQLCHATGLSLDNIGVEVQSTIDGRSQAVSVNLTMKL